MVKNNRTENFKRNDQLESFLTEVNNDLYSVEKSLLKNKDPKFPVIFIMGPLRSGTTLLTQWLANTGVVAYPTNFMSRFYKAPIMGAKIQRLLTDKQYNFRNEILDFNSKINYSSENGKTKGALAPNEFWYFWRRFLPYGDLDYLSDEKLFEKVDTKTMLAEFAGITDVFQKPFALKGMILNYNIQFLDKVFEKAIFVQSIREPVTNVASILEARKRQLGSEKEWYSFKIPEYTQLKDLDPITQSAGQLHYINNAVTKGMATVNESRKLIVKYEEFCHDPKSVFENLLSKLDLTGDTPAYNGPEQFKHGRDRDGPNCALIEKALSTFF